MTQAGANPINSGTQSRLDLRDIRESRVSHALNVPTVLGQFFFDGTFVKSLKLLSSAKKSYFFITLLPNNAEFDEEAFIGTHYDIEPDRTDEDFLRDYEALMAPLEPHLHEFVDIDLPIVDEGGDW